MDPIQIRRWQFYKRNPDCYGGVLCNTRYGRSRGRPLGSNLHLVMRSTLATGAWSFRKSAHRHNIDKIITKFSLKHGIRVVSFANVGNHLHFHISLCKGHNFKAFIRAISAAIAMSVSGSSRWKQLARKFWDHRPFTRIVRSLTAQKRLKDYILINQLEAMGACRPGARFTVAWANSPPEPIPIELLTKSPA